jgi:glutaredoxin
VEVVTFTLESCGACIELKNVLKAKKVPFRNIFVNERLGSILEKEYLTGYYPIVAIMDKETKIPYWVFVTESPLEDPKVIHWETIGELAIKIKNKYDAL